MSPRVKARVVVSDDLQVAQAVEKAEFGEVEPLPEGRVIVGRGSVIDAVQITKMPPVT